VVLTMDGGRVAHCSIGLTNLADTPLLAEEAAASLVGGSLDDASIARAADLARAIMAPAADARGPVEYKIHVGGIMVARAIRRAAARAA
jgi:carbon-monoxide dehydrogenase medium subunit